MTLFIGGPADGEWIATPPGRETWEIAASKPPAESSFRNDVPVEYEVVTYYRHKLFGADGSEYSVMMTEKKGCPLRALMAGYGKGKGE